MKTHARASAGGASLVFMAGLRGTAVANHLPPGSAGPPFGNLCAGLNRVVMSRTREFPGVVGGRGELWLCGGSHRMDAPFRAEGGGNFFGARVSPKASKMRKSIAQGVALGLEP